MVAGGADGKWTKVVAGRAEEHKPLGWQNGCGRHGSGPCKRNRVMAVGHGLEQSSGGN